MTLLEVYGIMQPLLIQHFSGQVVNRTIYQLNEFRNYEIIYSLTLTYINNKYTEISSEDTGQDLWVAAKVPKPWIS